MFGENSSSTFLHNYKNVLLLGIFSIAFIVRFLFLDVYPKGIDADEAYAGYEAYSLLNYGIDSWGYKNPVYLKTWGSGMSVLYSILTIPMIALFGVKAVSVRLPQCFLGFVTIILFYKVLKKIVSNEFALWGSFLLAISPWHIVMCRFGLDCNLAPFMLMLSIYLSILALDKSIYLLASAVSWGISLYSYAILWIFVPVFLTCLFIYLAICRKLPKRRYMVGFIGILFLIAAPLLLFVIVNMGLLDEIRTNVISIPVLTVYRADEISLSNILSNIKALFRIFIKQEDATRNVLPHFGIFYLISLPFILYGGVLCIKQAMHKIKERCFSYEVLLILWIFIYIVTGMFTNMSVHRINGVFLPLYILLAHGTYDLILRLGG